MADKLSKKRRACFKQPTGGNNTNNNISLKVIKRLDSVPGIQPISGAQIGGGQHMLSMFDSEIDKNSSSYHQSLS